MLDVRGQARRTSLLAPPALAASAMHAVGAAGGSVRSAGATGAASAALLLEHALDLVAPAC
jgi:hypothetical protein